MEINIYLHKHISKKTPLLQKFIKRFFFLISIDQPVERILCYFCFIYAGLYVLTRGPYTGLMLSQCISHLVMIEGNAI